MPWRPTSNGWRRQQLVERYLRVYPEDVDARVRLAEVFDKVAEATPSKIPASERLFSVAVGLAPDRAALRLRHAHRLLQLGRFGDALTEAEESPQARRRLTPKRCG